MCFIVQCVNNVGVRSANEHTTDNMFKFGFTAGRVYFTCACVYVYVGAHMPDVCVYRVERARV